MASTLGGFIAGIGLGLFLAVLIIGMFSPSIGMSSTMEGGVLMLMFIFGCILIIVGVLETTTRGEEPLKEKLPSPLLSKPKYNQYYCNTCGYSGQDEYPELKVSHCQKCGSQHIIWFGPAEYGNQVKPSPFTIRIKTVEHEEPLPPPPPPFEQSKYRSQFHCNSCGRSFWVYEHRLKIPYCCECGAPNPIFVATAEQ